MPAFLRQPEVLADPLVLLEPTVTLTKGDEFLPCSQTWHDREWCAWQHGNMESRTLTDRRGMDMQRLTDRLNTPVQGTGTDGLKLALALLCKRRDECLGAMPVLVCHDEIVVECVAEQAVGVKG